MTIISSIGLFIDMNQKKRVENLKNAYQSMDEGRRAKMELIANGLLNVQMLVDEKRPKSWVKKGVFKNGS
jgi:hypothetical protein